MIIRTHETKIIQNSNKRPLLTKEEWVRLFEVGAYSRRRLFERALIRGITVIDMIAE